MYKWGISVLVILSIFASIIWYVRYNNKLQESYLTQISQLKSNNGVLKDTLSSNLEELEKLTANYEINLENFNQLTQQFKDISVQTTILKEKFDRHDLKALALAKPSLIENIINKSSNDATRCFEILSGSPLTEREQNAKSDKEFNKECPWLYSNISSTD